MDEANNFQLTTLINVNEALFSLELSYEVIYTSFNKGIYLQPKVWCHVRIISENITKKNYYFHETRFIQILCRFIARVLTNLKRDKTFTESRKYFFLPNSILFMSIIHRSVFLGVIKIYANFSIICMNHCKSAIVFLHFEAKFVLTLWHLELLYNKFWGSGGLNSHRIL